MKTLQDKIAIVTGAGGGFGEGIARLFVAEGARVLIADLDADRAQAVAASLGPAAKAVRCDVSVGADVQAAVQACAQASAFRTLWSTTPAPRTATSQCWTSMRPRMTVFSMSTSSPSST